jgi:hypothetical protein
MSDQQNAFSETELEEIRRRCEGATPGPWKSLIEGRDHTSGCSFIMTGQGDARGNDIELSGATIADHDFIAHARQDIPRLLDEISKLKNFSVYVRRERERLIRERQAIRQEQRQLNQRLAELDRELSAINAYEAAKSGRSTTQQGRNSRRPQRVHRGSKRERLLQLLRQHQSGLTRREILEKMGLKGDKAEEMSVSNALTALRKTGQVARDQARRYIPAQDHHAIRP